MHDLSGLIVTGANKLDMDEMLMWAQRGYETGMKDTGSEAEERPFIIGPAQEGGWSIEERFSALAFSLGWRLGMYHANYGRTDEDAAQKLGIKP